MSYEVIVIGAGVEGSATARASAKDGYKTLLLEQFPLPHPRGSSHGQSRIIRHGYTQKWYAQMMPMAYRMWQELEEEENVEIYLKSGILTIDTSTSQDIENTARALDSVGITYDRLHEEDLSKRFPMFHLDEGAQALFETEGGILRADRALKCIWNQFLKARGTLHDGETVKQIIPGSTVTVVTDKQRYQGKSVVVCAGPWTDRLLRPLGLHLPLQPSRIGVYFWKSKTDQFTYEKGMPVFRISKACLGTRFRIYGFPALEYPDHVKICSHSGPATDPDRRDSTDVMQQASSDLTDLKGVVMKYFPGLEPDPSIQEACIYTMTPDEGFILDTHPHWKNIVIGAGFSGHGFKLAPVVGRLLTELATGREPTFDLEPFYMTRFADCTDHKPKL